MNEKLQFSWGHIFAFLALIAVSYFTFVGLTYITDGNFTTGLIGMGIVDIVFIVFFIGAQQMKASGVNIRRKIFFERLFVFGSPIVFIIGMIPTFHFWTVHSQDDEVVETFKASIENSKKMFDDYEAYSNERIAAYEASLDEVIANHGAKVEEDKTVNKKVNPGTAKKVKTPSKKSKSYVNRPPRDEKENKTDIIGTKPSEKMKEASKKSVVKNVNMKNRGHIELLQAVPTVDRYTEIGFKSEIARQQKDNMVEVLRLQLLSDNYYNLKNSALEWIVKANNGASTWNVFLLGNKDTIKNAIENWQKQLASFTEKKMIHEDLFEPVPIFESSAAEDAVSGINGLASIFTTQKGPNSAAILTAIILYLMLIFPYLLQERHTKSIYRLVGNEHNIKRKDTRSKKVATAKRKKHRDDDDEDDETKYEGPLDVTEDGDYPTF